MKKFMSLSLAFVLVVAMGAMAFAAELPLQGDLNAKVPVTVEIGPYAKVWLQQRVDFGTLVGKVGLYTANGLDGTPEEFYHRAATMFGEPDLANDFDETNDNSTGHGAFWVESNTDVTVGIGFDPSGWLASPTLFAVARLGDATNARAWASANFSLSTDTQTSFAHLYSEQGNEPVYYGIDGAIWIQYISQQLANEYNGTITITLSK